MKITKPPTFYLYKETPWLAIKVKYDADQGAKAEIKFERFFFYNLMKIAFYEKLKKKQENA